VFNTFAVKQSGKFVISRPKYILYGFL